MFVTLFIQASITLPVSSTAPVSPFYTNPPADTSSMLRPNCSPVQRLRPEYRRSPTSYSANTSLHPYRFCVTIYEMMVARQIVFIGRVQGVGFRFTAHRIANRHQLTGFVRNLHDGSVEMLAQGNAQDVEDCISDINQTFAGYIREAKITDLPPNPRYSDFKITF